MPALTAGLLNPKMIEALTAVAGVVPIQLQAEAIAASRTPHPPSEIGSDDTSIAGGKMSQICNSGVPPPMLQTVDANMRTLSARDTKASPTGAAPEDENTMSCKSPPA